MVSGLTPPSKRDLDEKRDENIESLRDSVRFSAPTTNVLNTMGSKVGGGGSQMVPAVQGLFATNPAEKPEAIEITYTETTTTNPLKVGDEISTTANGWKGKLIEITNTNVGNNSARYEALFANSSTTAFSNTSQTFSKTGWAATYLTNSQTINALVLTSSAPIVSTSLTGGNPTIQQIYGTRNNGQILFMKPKDGKTLTLATGGNIDISSNVTVSDDEFVILQYFEDVNAGAGKYLLLSGGGGSSTWVGTATSNLNMGAFYIEGSWGGTSNLLGISSSLEMMNNNIIDVNQVQLTGTSGDVVHGYLSSSAGVLNIVSNANGGDIDFYVKNNSGTQQKVINIDGNNGLTTLENTALSIKSSSNVFTQMISGNTALLNSPAGGYDFQIAASSKLILSSSLLSSAVPLAMSGQKITGLGTPTATTDAATKAYVDGSGGSTSFIGFQADANLDMNGRDIIDVDDIKFKVTSGTSPSIAVSSNSTVMNFDVNNINAMNLSEANGDPTLELIGNPSPEVKLRSTDSSPYDGQITGGLYFDAFNSSSTLKTFGSLKFITADITSGTEDGQFRMTMLKNGSAIDILNFKNTELDPNTTDVYSLGTSTNRFDDVYTKYVNDVEQISFSKTISGQFIHSNTGGLEYYVPNGDDHEFWVDNGKRAEISETSMALSVQLTMNANNLVFSSGGRVDFANDTGTPTGAGGYVRVKIGGVDKWMPYYS